MKTLIDLSTKIFEDKELFHKTDGDEVEFTERIIVQADGIKKSEKVKVNGCSYNKNRDTDKLCFKNALARFIKTGTKQDAFDIFFCYSEIFRTFGGYKNGIDTLLELLYQHESNSANLLMKHRDHYSHSAYVFALGTAIFMHNESLRKAFASLYGQDKLYENFLRYWGLASLFHDVGYPYEITFQQALQYGKKIAPKKSSRLQVSYTNLQGFAALTPKEVRGCGQFMPKAGRDANTLFAARIAQVFGEGTVDDIRELLIRSVAEADEYIDHGYFGAVLLLKKLLKTPDFTLDEPTLDAVTAILLHNSFYKIIYKKFIGKGRYKQVNPQIQPIAYLLMLCDELQCWDRTAYGELSKKQEVPWDFDIAISEGQINLKYYFENDGKCVAKIKKLISDINEKVVNTGELAAFTTSVEIKKKDKKVYDYFSDSKFINLCKIAETVCIKYNNDGKKAGNKNYLQQKFDELTLEYKLSNIGQAKQYARHLDDVKCFYSDRRLDYPVVKKFTPDEVRYLAMKEHIRWVSEKVDMGWHYGELTDVVTDENSQYTMDTREIQRMHKDIVPYEMLEQSEADKDINPVNNMVGNLNKYGIKVYRMFTDKPEYSVGCTGHIDLSRIKDFVKREAGLRTEINAYFTQLKEKYEVVLYSGLANGSDSLFAEEAQKCGIPVIAVLPCNWKEFREEQKDGNKFMQLFGMSSEVRLCLNGYVGVMKNIISNCDEILTLWDGVALPLYDDNDNEINRGGTYDIIRTALSEQKIIKHFI